MSNKTIMVRMLVASLVQGIEYLANQLVRIPEPLGKSLVKNNCADDSAGAVAYCKDELKIDPVDHVELVAALNPEPVLVPDAASSATGLPSETGSAGDVNNSGVTGGGA